MIITLLRINFSISADGALVISISLKSFASLNIRTEADICLLLIINALTEIRAFDL